VDSKRPLRKKFKEKKTKKNRFNKKKMSFGQVQRDAAFTNVNGNQHGVFDKVVAEIAALGTITSDGKAVQVNNIYTVATLPTPAVGNQGLRASVTDGSLVIAASFGLAVVAGGALFTPVFSDGTDWLIG